MLINVNVPADDDDDVRVCVDFDEIFSSFYDFIVCTYLSSIDICTMYQYDTNFRRKQYSTIIIFIYIFIYLLEYKKK